MFRIDQFEKFSTVPAWVRPQNTMTSGACKKGTGIGNAFAFLILTLLVLSGATQAAAEGAQSPLDLNQATSAQLEALPGIGAVKAAAILAVRDEKGGFDSMEQLESVRGIGPALMTKLRPLVRLGKSGAPSGKPSAKTGAKPKSDSGSAAKTSAGVPGRSTK